MTKNDPVFVFVAHGDHPLPPAGWGAVENLIWQFYTRIQGRGHQVHLVNRKRFGAVFEVLRLSLRGEADIVHCHAEKPIPMLSWLARWRKFMLISTTHQPISNSQLTKSNEKAIRRCQYAPYHLVLRDDIKDLILDRNPSAICATQVNGAETAEFKCRALGNGKAIYVGRIQERKGQNRTALLLKDSGIECHFVGPVMEDVTISDELRAKMVGSWDREKLHDHLCDYSCLILLSEAEGQPLVVIEALAAGIPVVVSPDAAWNLDTSKPFIFVAVDDNQVVEMVRRAISVRDQYSAEIRAYAQEVFDYDVVIDNYLRQVQSWRGSGTVN